MTTIPIIRKIWQNCYHTSGCKKTPKKNPRKSETTPNVFVVFESYFSITENRLLSIRGTPNAYCIFNSANGSYIVFFYHIFTAQLKQLNAPPYSSTIGAILTW